MENLKLKKKYNVLITRRIPINGLDILKKKCNILLNEKDKPLDRKELLNKVKNMDAILCFLNDKIDKQVMDAAGPSLKIISTFSTGYEHIDIDEAKKRNIEIGYTGNILTETTADLTFALILVVSRRIVEADRFVREQKWKYGWSPDLMLGNDIHQKTIGIIGMGKIGRAVARRAEGFGMKILYNNRNMNVNFKDTELLKKTELVDLDKLLKESDFVVITCSLNKDSYHLINLNNIKKMKPSAYLINTARGKIVEEIGLISALKKKIIAGAALDVFDKEPIDKNNPLLIMKNVVLLPHIGSASISTREKMSEISAKNILNVLENNYKDALLIED